MSGHYHHRAARGSLSRVDYHARYLEFLQRHFSPENLRGGQVALNGLNGTAATMAELVATDFELPVTWFRKFPGPYLNKAQILLTLAWQKRCVGL